MPLTTSGVDAHVPPMERGIHAAETPALPTPSKTTTAHLLRTSLRRKRRAPPNAARASPRSAAFKPQKHPRADNASINPHNFPPPHLSAA